MATLFQDPEQKKPIGDALALALLGGAGQDSATGLPSPEMSSTLSQWVTPGTATSYQTLLNGGQAPALSWWEDGGQAATPDPGVYGQMTQDERNALSGTRVGVASLGQLASALGFATPAPAMMGTMLGIAMGLDGRVNRGVRGVTQRTTPELQGLADRFGYGMPQATPGPAMDAIGGYSPDPGTVTGSMSLGDAMGVMGESYGGGVGGGSGPGGSPSGDMGGEGTSDSPYAKGGAKVFTKPSRPLVGEAGDELGIFVKPEMMQPGIQGRERQVRRALLRAMMNLR